MFVTDFLSSEWCHSNGATLSPTQMGQHSPMSLRIIVLPDLPEQSGWGQLAVISVQVFVPDCMKQTKKHSISLFEQ